MPLKPFRSAASLSPASSHNSHQLIHCKGLPAGNWAVRCCGLLQPSSAHLTAWCQQSRRAATAHRLTHRTGQPAAASPDEPGPPVLLLLQWDFPSRSPIPPELTPGVVPALLPGCSSPYGEERQEMLHAGVPRGQILCLSSKSPAELPVPTGASKCLAGALCCPFKGISQLMSISL